VKARADEADALRVVVDDDEEQGADPRALEPVEAADDGDHQQVDGCAEVDRRGVDVAVPPDEEHTADRSDEAGECERDRAVKRHVVAERGHANRVVSDALERQPERRPNEVAQQEIHGQRNDERDVIEAIRMIVDVADRARRRDPADSPEPGDVRHLAEEEVGDHRIGERDHQEVDADAAIRECAEQERHDDRKRDADDDAPVRTPTEVESLRVSVRRHVAEHEAGNPVDGDLRKGDHAAVRRQKDEARRCDSEEEHLREQLSDPVGRDVPRRCDRKSERKDGDNTVGCDAACRHAGLPNKPCGRTASTSAISTNVKMIE
jgi:hypothetical protein